MCLPQVIKSFQNYRGVATTFYPTLVFELHVHMHKYSKEEASFTHAESLSNEGLEEMQQKCVLKIDTGIGVGGTQL